MLRYIDKLPGLPVPDLFETIREYLEWVKPLLSAEEFSNTQNIVGEFTAPNGIGVKLQEKLVLFQKRSQELEKNRSWLKPLWDKMYLSFRDPLVLNMNYYSIIENQKFKDNLTPSQLASLAIVKSTMTYFGIIDKSMKPDMSRDIPMCMEQYINTLKVVRIPDKCEDEYRLGEVTKKDNHVVLFLKNNMYQIKVSDENGEIASLESISLTIDDILNKNLDDRGDDISAFTTAARDDAADIYKELLSDDENRRNIEIINEAVIVVCIDEKMDSQNDLGRSLLLSDGKNRYFDKSSQIIITTDCEIGFNNEHTGADGTTWFTIIDTIYDFIIENMNNVNTDVVTKAEYNLLKWNIDNGTRKKLNQMLCDHRKISENIVTTFMNYDEFGKNYIKSLRISPDAFFHIALQLAQYRTFNCLRSTYEPVAMRTYRDGRTECARAVNEKVKALVEQFDQCIDTEILKNMILEAADAHIDRIKICQAGMGVERHLYGLSKMNESEADETNVLEFFSDVAYKKLKTDFISTSGLGSENIRCFGFGPVVSEGFGIGYGIKQNNISCTISCRISNKENSDTLIKNLSDSFRDIAGILDCDK